MTQKAEHGPKSVMNAAEYAAHRGVSERAVYKAMKTRITGAIIGRGKLDREKADRLWQRNTEPDRGGRVERFSEVQELRKQAVRLGVDPESVPDISDSKALRLACLAALAQIELDEKQGRLIDQDDVSKEAFKLARKTRDAMLAIPDRLSAELAGMTDPFAVHARLTAEIRAAIDQVMQVAE